MKHSRLLFSLATGALLGSSALAQEAKLQIIHNSADAAAAVVDIYVNDALFLDDVAFRTATDFMDVPAEADLAVGIAPGTSTSADDIIATFDYNLANGGKYIIVANGIVSASGYTLPGSFDLDVYDMAREEATAMTNTDVLVIHGATDAPTVDVAELAFLSGATVIDDLAYGTFNDYLELGTANYILQVQTADGVPVQTYGAPLADLMLDGSAITVVASGFLDPTMNSDGPGFGLWVATAAGGALIPLPVVEPPAATAKLQIIHNSADAAAAVVDIYVNDALFLDDVAFRTATDFMDVPAEADLAVGIAPGTSTSADDIIATFDYNLANGGKYIIVANGIVSATGYTLPGSFDLDVYDMAREEATAMTNTDVLVIHGATDAPTVDVAELAFLSGATVIDDLAYGTFNDYLELGTANYILQVQTADGVPVQTYGAPLADLMLDGSAITVVASGFLDPTMNSDGPGFGLWVATAAGGALIPLPVVEPPAATAKLQIIHNSADAAAAVVDIYVNDALFLDDVAFRTATDFMDVPAEADLAVGIAPGTSTSADDIIATFDYNLANGGKYIIVANGIVSATGYTLPGSFDLDVYDMAREEATAMTNTDVLVIHGATDAPTVDVAELAFLSGATVIDDLAYGTFNDYLELGTANYILQVQTADGVPVQTYGAPLADLMLDGSAITVVASGFLDPTMNSDGPGFGLWVATAAGGALIPLPVVEPPAATAKLQIIHNSADAAAAVVDIYVNDALFLDDVAFRTATDFMDVPAEADLAVGIAPGTSTSADDIIATFDYNLANGGKYIIVANGIVSATGYTLPGSFDLDVYDMAREEATAMTNTDVLVIHGATDAPTVDVAELAFLSGATVIDDLAYGTFNDYLELGTANYILQVQTADGVPVQTYGAPLADLMLDGSAITVVASGFLDPTMNSDGPGFGLWVATAAGGALIPLPVVEPPAATAKLQIIHNSADAAAAVVDIYVNDALFLDDVAFRTATDFMDVPAEADLAVGIAPGTSTSADDIIATFDYNLANGGKYIIVANGIVSATGYTLPGSFDLDVYDMAREEATAMMNTDVLVIHGATDAPTVDVAELAFLSGATVIDDLAYGEFEDYLELGTANYALQVQTADGVPVATYSAPLADLMLDGAAITVVASGFLDPTMNSNGPAFGLWVATAAGGALIPLPLITNVGLNDVQDNTLELNVWPNPANDVLNISVDAREERRVNARMTDMTGRVVIESSNSILNAGENRLMMDLNGLSQGMYTLSLTSEKGIRTIQVQVSR